MTKKSQFIWSVLARGDPAVVLGAVHIHIDPQCGPKGAKDRLAYLRFIVNLDRLKNKPTSFWDGIDNDLHNMRRKLTGYLSVWIQLVHDIDQRIWDGVIRSLKMISCSSPNQRFWISSLPYPNRTRSSLSNTCSSLTYISRKL
ncbi:hypothetical protein MJO28_010320, partial [Puccinia striiformis f. sp. tritici]